MASASSSSGRRRPSSTPSLQDDSIREKALKSSGRQDRVERGRVSGLDGDPPTQTSPLMMPPTRGAMTTGVVAPVVVPAPPEPIPAPAEDAIFCVSGWLRFS